MCLSFTRVRWWVWSITSKMRCSSKSKGEGSGSSHVQSSRASPISRQTDFRLANQYHDLACTNSSSFIRRCSLHSKTRKASIWSSPLSRCYPDDYEPILTGRRENGIPSRNQKENHYEPGTMASKRKASAMAPAVEEPVDPADELLFLCLGGGNEVGRSCHILQYKGKTVMVSLSLWIHLSSPTNLNG